MPRVAQGIPDMFKHREIVAIAETNPRNRGSIGEKTFNLIREYGCLTVEEYVYLCEKKLNLTIAQAIKELRTDMGTESILISHPPQWPEVLSGEVQIEDVILPQKLKIIADELKSKQTQLNYELDNINFYKDNNKLKEESLKKLEDELAKRKTRVFQDEIKAQKNLEESKKILRDAKRGIECSKTVQDVKETSDIVYPEWWGKFVSLAQIRQNILLKGPSGCGKTHMAKLLADELKLRYGSISCSAGISESNFLGRRLPENNGNFKYNISVFLDMFENGGIMLLDEIDAADENTLIIINSALANTQIHVDLRNERTLFKKHKDFVCVAASNTFGQGTEDDYQRNVLDASTLSRFRAGIIVCEYSEQVEKSLVNKYVYEWGIKIREFIKERNLRHIMGTREMLDFSRQANTYNWGQKEWEKSFFANWKDFEIESARQAKIISESYKHIGD